MQSYLPLITGSGGALVVLAIVAYLLGVGKLHPDTEYQRLVKEVDDLKAALETERTTNNELARAGGVTTKLIGALVDVATDRHDTDRHREAAHPPPELTAEDLGLLCGCDCHGGAGWLRRTSWTSRPYQKPRCHANGSA